MNQDDKLKHIEAYQKDITAVCFDHCFHPKKFKLDFDCVPVCYQKYLHAANMISSTIIEQGRESKSDYVIRAVGKVEKDRFMDTITPVGGYNLGQGEDDTQWRYKSIESFRYSDPATSGR